MIKQSILFILLVAFVQVFAKDKQLTREEYIQKYYKLAISEMQRSGIPASITLAQGCWESGNGNSRLATEGNNHFGIKCKKDWAGKKIYHDDDANHECFRKYAHAEASYIDHTDYLMTVSRYRTLFQLDQKDYAGWARGLKNAGYATDPIYAERIIKIIEDFKLYIYDEYVDNRQMASYNDTRQMASLNQKSTPSKSRDSKLGKTNSMHKIERLNGLRSIVVGEGDTYESITRDLSLSDWELYTYNDFEEGRQPQVNEILYLEMKYKKADRSRRQHIAENGDTMHYIAQKYGLRLNSLLKRNRMKEGDEPVDGQIIYLRNKKPRIFN